VSGHDGYQYIVFPRCAPEFKDHAVPAISQSWQLENGLSQQDMVALRIEADRGK